MATEVTRSVPRPYNAGEYRISKLVIGPRGGKRWEIVHSQSATGGGVVLRLEPGRYKETYWSNGWPTSKEFEVLGQPNG